MRRDRVLDDCDAWKLERQHQDDTINEAFADILQGKFDSQNVHEALRLGHHPEYHQLREAIDTAERAARAAGAPS